MRLPHRVVWFLSLVCTLAYVPASFAQPYPDKPVRMVVPFPAGGSNDIVARLLAQKLGEYLGQQFIIDNRGGAGGAIGAQTVANATPDGYTLLLTNPGPGIHNVLLRRKPLYGINDFAPIMHIGSASSIVVANTRLPVANMKELVAYAKANPGKVNWASGGNNSNTHISIEVLKAATGIDVLHIPYKGTSPALTDVLSGQADTMFTSVIAAEAHIISGRLKVMGVAGARRHAAIPDVATFEEQGIRRANVYTWYGMVTTAKTPRAIIEKLNAALNRALDQPEIRQRLEHLGLEVAGGTPARFGAFMQEEAENLTRLIKRGALKVES
jgi:tripartite-type tricarboxylate transporter receptor subunit TctC